VNTNCVFVCYPYPNLSSYLRGWRFALRRRLATPANKRDPPRYVPSCTRDRTKAESSSWSKSGYTTPWSLLPKCQYRGSPFTLVDYLKLIEDGGSGYVSICASRTEKHPVSELRIYLPRKFTMLWCGTDSRMNGRNYRQRQGLHCPVMITRRRSLGSALRGSVRRSACTLLKPVQRFKKKLLLSLEI